MGCSPESKPCEAVQRRVRPKKSGRGGTVRQTNKKEADRGKTPCSVSQMRRRWPKSGGRGEGLEAPSECIIAQLDTPIHTHTHDYTDISATPAAEGGRGREEKVRGGPSETAAGQDESRRQPENAQTDIDASYSMRKYTQKKIQPQKHQQSKHARTTRHAGVHDDKTGVHKDYA